MTRETFNNLPQEPGANARSESSPFASGGIGLNVNSRSRLTTAVTVAPSFVNLLQRSGSLFYLPKETTMPYVIIIRELRKDPTLALKLALGEPTFLPPHLNRLFRLGGVRTSDVVRYARREVFGKVAMV